MLIDAFGLQNRVAAPKLRIAKSPESLTALELCLGIVWKLLAGSGQNHPEDGPHNCYD